MIVLFKNVKMYAPGSTNHLQQTDILIENGRIGNTGSPEVEPDFVVEEENLWVSAGWFDMHTEITDPGFEHKESLASAAETAAAGGFTRMLCFGNTEPKIQTKNAILALLNQAETLSVQMHVAALATVNAEGKDLTEMLDMQHHGAIAFSDGSAGIQQAEVLLKALQYLQISNTVLINRAEHKALNGNGQMHEGFASTRLGLKGMPALAEEIQLTRDLELLAFNGGRLHIPFVSTAVAVAKIREAKQKGLQVTCGIASYQLAFTDEEVLPFDTNYKVNPPFRSATDRRALIEGLQDGTIDVLVSGHKPQDNEVKNLEFDLAAFGIINSQTAFSIARTFAPELPVELLLEKMVVNPRRILGLPLPEFKAGEAAELTFFQPDTKWFFTEGISRSKSKNSPFFNRELTGEVYGIVSKGRFIQNETTGA